MKDQTNNQNGRQPVNAVKPSVKIRSKVERCIQDLQNGLYEREEAIKLCLLALLAGEHVFMQGSPGVAKSLLAERLTRIIKDGKLFTHLMTKYTQPEELFGPFAISKLKNDIFERNTESKLPKADLVFLDEIWKSNSTILNTLLTALNERKFCNGAQDPNIPLHSMICASNEGPQAGNSLEALYDRLLVRIYVESIQDKKKLKSFLSEDEGKKEWKIKPENQFEMKEIKEIGEISQLVKIPDEIAELLVMLEDELSVGDKENAPMEISVRRLKKLTKLLRVSAWVSGREKVNLNDCALVPHCLWEKPEQKKMIAQKMESIIKDKLFQTISRVEEFSKKSEELKLLMKAKDKNMMMVTMIGEKFLELKREIKKEVDLSYEKEREKKEENTESVFFTVKLSEFSVRDLRKTRTELENISDTLEAAFQEFVLKVETEQTKKAA